MGDQLFLLCIVELGEDGRKPCLDAEYVNDNEYVCSSKKRRRRAKTVSHFDHSCGGIYMS